jgi:hypothetical protein
LVVSVVAALAAGVAVSVRFSDLSERPVVDPS